MNVDLHSHTTESDGATAPRDLVRLAAEGGISVLAVTDHDTLAAVGVCLEEGERRGVRVVPGIEMTAREGREDVHVLGYGLDWRSAPLIARLESMQQARRDRVVEICARLKQAGAALEPEEVFREGGEGTIGRKHVARALHRKGLVTSVDDAFRRYLGAGGAANVPAGGLTPAEAAELIIDHGGIPVLAHPGFISSDAVVERILDEAPIRGIEVYHRYASETRHLAYLEMARRRNLLVTGGSDFHGDDGPRNAPLGSYLCPAKEWMALERRLAAG